MDLSLLYSELGLAPDCSFDEFRSAYMRRIAELHPDRSGGRVRSPEAQAALHELISTYAAVTRFHRRYGRMPGESPRTSGVRSLHGVDSVRSATPPSMQAPDEDEHSTRPALTLVALLLALLVLLASWDWLMLRSQ